MSVTGALHVLLACVAALCALVVAVDPERLRARWAQRGALASAALSLLLALWGQRAFEAGRLRTVYANSRTAGEWLERHMHVGLLALCFSAVLGLMSEARPARQRRMVAWAVVACTAAALFCDALVHARAPVASLE